MPSYLSSYLSFFQGVNEEGILRRRIEAVITGQTRNLLALFIGLVGSNPTVSAIEGSLAKLGFVRIFSLFRREDVIRQLMPSPVSIASAEDIFD